LIDTFPEWTVTGLTVAAYNTARLTDDISLVGLAARVQDTVVLAAARESVVLYAREVIGAALNPPEYIWKVDEDLAEAAGRFIDTFNALFSEKLPPPVPAQAERYWHASEDNEILGRCVRLGYDDRNLPVRHYHRGICRGDDGGLTVHEFWQPEVWTTTQYRSALGFRWRRPEF
jgi:hypothetical protein